MAASNSNRRARRKLRPTCYTRSTLNVSLLLVFSVLDRKSTRLNSSHLVISYAVFCLKKKKQYLAYFDHADDRRRSLQPLRLGEPRLDRDVTIRPRHRRVVRAEPHHTRSLLEMHTRLC